MTKTTRVFVALLVPLVLLAIQFVGESSVVGPVAAQGPTVLDCRRNCPKDASKVENALAMIGYGLSACVILFPWIRVTKEKTSGQENIGSDRCFMAFLAIACLDYFAWTGYSLKGCQYCDAAVYMIGISVFGFLFCFWQALALLMTGDGYTQQKNHRKVLVFIFLLFGAIIAVSSYKRKHSGPAALIGALLSQLFRIVATDYTQFSCPQVVVSLAGVINGILCTRHPHLILAKSFWLAVVLVAVIRALELIWWTMLFCRTSPRLRRSLQKARRWFSHP